MRPITNETKVLRPFVDDVRLNLIDVGEAYEVVGVVDCFSGGGAADRWERC